MRTPARQGTQQFVLDRIWGGKRTGDCLPMTEFGATDRAEKNSKESHRMHFLPLLSVGCPTT